MNVKSTNLNVTVENNFLEFSNSFRRFEHLEITYNILREEEEVCPFFEKTVNNFH